MSVESVASYLPTLALRRFVFRQDQGFSPSPEFSVTSRFALIRSGTALSVLVLHIGLDARFNIVKAVVHKKLCCEAIWSGVFCDFYVTFLYISKN